MTPTPHEPRITKSTPVATIKTYFQTEEELLIRYDLAKEQANLWDGERDGLRNAMKQISSGTWGRCMLSRKITAAVCYPNAEGKHQLENTLQTDIPEIHGLEPGTHVVVLTVPKPASDMAIELTERLLHELQKGKDSLVQFIADNLIGHGHIIENATLYKKEEGEKADLVILP